MKPFGKGDSTPRLRLSGEGESVYNTSAWAAFTTVLQKALDVQRPGRLASASYTDPAIELENAVRIASLYCNSELLDRLNTFYDAVLDSSRGAGSEQEVEKAREIFTAGCREALDNSK